jgi:prefoldin subunit 5
MDHPALSRIDRAIDRIEAATATRREALQHITDRHARLKQRMREAVAALDAVLATAEAE